MEKKELKKLPVDYSTLKNILNDNCLYIDKTQHAYELITKERRCFLSRPRRFGKSLFVSTLEEILRGNKELFKDLWIGSSDYHWEPLAVIKLDFSKMSHKNADEFETNLIHTLYKTAQAHQIPLRKKSSILNIVLDDLIEALLTKYTAVAVLVDEYDKPLVHNLDNPPVADKIRAVIQTFFSALKGFDDVIKFIFITGVSSFAKSGIFSGINNLQVLSLNENYAAICGYTDQEINTYLHDHIQAWADKKNTTYDLIRDKLRIWYNGYNFAPETARIYNPFSVLNALKRQLFKNFWVASASPSFLIYVLKKQPAIFNLDQMHTTEEMLETFDINKISLEPLLFQAGYLTISDYNLEEDLYKLDYPNLEVKVSFQKYLLEAFAHLPQNIDGDALSLKLRTALNTNDLEQAVSVLTILFAHVPYLLHDPQEKYYHALLHMAVTGTGIEAYSDLMTAHGRIDMVIHTEEYLYIVEVKYNSTPQKALQQIHDQRYYERFLEQPKPIVLVGLSFNKTPGEFNITYASEMLQPPIKSV